jgi:hypothetical protein
MASNSSKHPFWVENNSKYVKSTMKRIAKQKGIPLGTYIRSLLIAHIEENKHKLLSEDLENN